VTFPLSGFFGEDMPTMTLITFETTAGGTFEAFDRASIRL
jgi:hypothetical protein